MRQVILSFVLAGAATSALAQTSPAPQQRGPMRGTGMSMWADADGDGIVTREEAAAAAATAFDRIDINHDGKVTSDEMRAARDAMRRGRGGDRPLPPPEQ